MAASRERGTTVLLLATTLGLGTALAVAASLAGPASRLARDRVSDRAIATALEALLAYAAARPIDAAVGPGYLPCPDLDDDGWAESTCGSMNGSSGQAQRLGRLPWKTLGVADLRDGAGERLWYAVSSRHKGLLNCAASTACVDLSPAAALGTITVRDATGAIVQDGRIDDPARMAHAGAAAVVIAPGPPLAAQARESAAQRSDPRNYLDRATFEDNADFVDRNDASGRPGNANGFVAGPVRDSEGTIVVNDRIGVLAASAVASAAMRRVAQEIAQCVRAEGANAWPASACGDANVPSTWAPVAGARFGRVATATLAACGLAIEAGPTWWSTWRHHVFLARDVQPVDAAGAELGAARGFAVFVAGAALARKPTDAAGCPIDPYFTACWPGSACSRLRTAAGSEDIVVLAP